MTTEEKQPEEMNSTEVSHMDNQETPSEGAVQTAEAPPETNLADESIEATAQVHLDAEDSEELTLAREVEIPDEPDSQETPGEGVEDATQLASDVPHIIENPVAPAGKTASQAAEEASQGEAAPPPKPRAKRKRWYIVHTYSGHENKVKVNLERRIESMNMMEKIFRVEVPQKTVTKIKEGRRTEKEERIFPGYVLVEMIMDDDSWYVVRHTPGVTRFIGGQKRPVPAKDSEIKRILLRTAPVAQKVEIDLKVGETIRIVSGPFADFEGTVTEVYPDKEKLKANVSIFGRETPVELAFNQVQKM